MKAHCLFEQSGTFKNEFRKLGIEAYDYDIANDFGQTDYQIDLFAEIEAAWGGEKSVFDSISEDDIVLAFFPCTRFEAQISMMFRGEGKQQKQWDDLRKLEYNLKLFDELVTNYKAVSKMAMVCLRKHVKLMIENPANKPHFLTSYWCLKPSIIDNDRTKNGDYMKKPTQYWFIGFKPQNNLVFEQLEPVPLRKHEYMLCENGKKAKVLRSEIHPQYASRFIRQYILDESEVNNE